MDKSETNKDLKGVQYIPQFYNLTSEQFNELWRLCPQEDNYFKIYDKTVKLPRKHITLGAVYKFKQSDAKHYDID